MIHHKKAAGPKPRRRDGSSGSPKSAPAAAERFWFDWLASASAETAIGLAGRQRWLLAASSLESARVRLDDPVCQHVDQVLRKSLTGSARSRGWHRRPKPCERSVVLAVLSAVRTDSSPRYR